MLDWSGLGGGGRVLECWHRDFAAREGGQEGMVTVILERGGEEAGLGKVGQEGMVTVILERGGVEAGLGKVGQEGMVTVV